MKLPLWLSPALLCACAPEPQVAMAPTTGDAAFTSAYALFVGAPDRECIFSLTDTGTTNPSDVTLKLVRDGYDLKRGIEILYEENTLPHCIATAQQAATKAGFLNVRARLATEKDRFHGIP